MIKKKKNCKSNINFYIFTMKRYSKTPKAVASCNGANFIYADILNSPSIEDTEYFHHCFIKILTHLSQL